MTTLNGKQEVLVDSDRQFPVASSGSSLNDEDISLKTT